MKTSIFTIDNSPRNVLRYKKVHSEIQITSLEKIKNIVSFHDFSEKSPKSNKTLANSIKRNKMIWDYQETDYCPVIEVKKKFIQNILQLKWIFFLTFNI